MVQTPMAQPFDGERMMVVTEGDIDHKAIAKTRLLGALPGEDPEGKIFTSAYSGMSHSVVVYGRETWKC